jgi:hypothetical protein
MRRGGWPGRSDSASFITFSQTRLTLSAALALCVASRLIVILSNTSRLTKVLRHHE